VTIHDALEATAKVAVDACGTSNNAMWRLGSSSPILVEMIEDVFGFPFTKKERVQRWCYWNHLVKAMSEATHEDDAFESLCLEVLTKRQSWVRTDKGPLVLLEGRNENESSNPLLDFLCFEDAFKLLCVMKKSMGSVSYKDMMSPVFIDDRLDGMRCEAPVVVEEVAIDDPETTKVCSSTLLPVLDGKENGRTVDPLTGLYLPTVLDLFKLFHGYVDANRRLPSSEELFTFMGTKRPKSDFKTHPITVYPKNVKTLLSGVVSALKGTMEKNSISVDDFARDYNYHCMKESACACDAH